MENGHRREVSDHELRLEAKSQLLDCGIVQFAIIALAVLVADFAFLVIDDVPPVLNDDFSLYADLVWGHSRTPMTKIREIFLMSWEGRPLRAIEYLLQWLAYQFLGIRGGFIFQAALLSLLGHQFLKIVKPRLGARLALLAGLLLVLHPADSTHIWLATMMAKLSLLYTFFAIRCFAAGRERWASVLLILGFASYELSPFAFALAIWAREGNLRSNAKRAALVFLSAISLYALWRYFVFATVAPDLRGLASESAGLWTSLLNLSGGLVRILPLMLVESLCRSSKILQAAGISFIAFTIMAFAARRRKETPTPALQPDSSALLLGVAMGLFATLMGASLSFITPPTMSPGIASRHTIAALPGAALSLTALLGLAAQALSRRTRLRPIAAALTLSLLVLCTGNRWLIQKDYRDASKHQRRALHRMVEDLGPLPAHSLIVITEPQAIWPESERRPDDERAVDALVTGLPHEIESILGLVYDRSIVGLVLADERDLSRSQVATASQILAESPSSAFHNIASYDMATRGITWHRRNDQDKTRAWVKASGPAYRYLGM